MWQTAILSVINKMRWLASLELKISRPATMGKNSRYAILKFAQLSGYGIQNQLDPYMKAPACGDASDWRLMVLEFIQAG